MAKIAFKRGTTNFIPENIYALGIILNNFMKGKMSDLVHVEVVF